MPGWTYTKKKRARRKLKPFRGRPIAYALQWVVSLAIIGIGIYFFYRYLQESTVFAVQWVHVEGARALGPEAILAASDISTADNLLFFDAEGARARVEALPYIKVCRLARVFPDTVILTIEERTPVATLLVNNHLVELDPEGVILAEVAGNESHPGPLITNVPGVGILEPGQQLTSPALMAALGVWHAFSNVSMAQDVVVSELAALGKNDVRMYCDELPFEIRWGRGDFEDQAFRLDVLWREKGEDIECLEYLDLRFGKDLVCK